MSEPGPVDLDRDVLLQRIQEIRGALASLRVDAARPREAFVADGQAVDATKYRLLVAIEAAVSICMHLTSRLSARTPESYAECFDALGDAAVLSPDLAERLGRMARFRNRLVHVYWRIDNDRLWAILQENLGDLDEYLTAIGNLVDAGIADMKERRRLSRAQADAVASRLRERLTDMPEVRFAYLHGSMLDRPTVADVDVAVSVEPGSFPADIMSYELGLELALERGLDLPVDVRILEAAPLSFRYAVSRGHTLYVRDPDAWATFRERTWRDYLDFAPLREAALRDLARSPGPASRLDPPRLPPAK